MRGMVWSKEHRCVILQGSLLLSPLAFMPCSTLYMERGGTSRSICGSRYATCVKESQASAAMSASAYCILPIDSLWVSRSQRLYPTGPGSDERTSDELISEMAGNWPISVRPWELGVQDSAQFGRPRQKRLSTAVTRHEDVVSCLVASLSPP